MPDYKKMYLTLFNAITDALTDMEKSHFSDARDTLIKAQQAAEETYVSE